MVCGTKFLTKSKGPERELYCTKKCRTKANNAVHYAKIKKDLQKRICVVCSKEFEPVRYRPNQLTCSKECNLQRQNKIKRNGTDAPDQRECRECQLFLSLKKTITFIAPMNVLGAKQTGDMQRSRDMPHGYQHFSIKIDCWHFNATKFVKRAVQKAPCLFITGTVLVKQTRRIMLSIISEFFAESITSNYIRSITASSTANSLCSGKSLRLWAFSQ